MTAPAARTRLRVAPPSEPASPSTAAPPRRRLLWVPYGWFIEHWWTHRAEVPLRSVTSRSAYFGAVLGFTTAMLAYTSMVQDEVHDYCAYETSAERCGSWPMLSQPDCEAAQGCVNGSSTAPLCAGMVQPNFRCRWTSEDDLTPWTRLVAPAGFVQAASCVKAECPLYLYSRGIALEFAVLFLTLSYVSSFALHDVRRLLDRPGSAGDEERGSVGLQAAFNGAAAEVYVGPPLGPG